MKKQRKHYTPEEKVAILRRHLLDKEPISKLCDELGLQPTFFYRWQKEFFENGAPPSSRKHGRMTPPSGSESRTWRRRSRLRTRFWPS
jgi:transposase-like protein